MRCPPDVSQLPWGLLAGRKVSQPKQFGVAESLFPVLPACLSVSWQKRRVSDLAWKESISLRCTWPYVDDPDDPTLPVPPGQPGVSEKNLIRPGEEWTCLGLPTAVRLRVKKRHVWVACWVGDARMFCFYFVPPIWAPKLVCLPTTFQNSPLLVSWTISRLYSWA